ncbi:Sau3AI family type II restriction endonuclease [Flavobacterium sp. JP2137]|uniref:Sau3AI family type II restriction endonuclease n=1 Tax=Flavobacterium sp. JP2137 TaxID=3414510 RepID=UPI003D2FE385
MYNPSDKNSILAFAQQLQSQRLRNCIDVSAMAKVYRGKGNFGQLLEKYYFGYDLNSASEPDFAQAGLELKTAPLKVLKTKAYRSKERLVLNLINYVEIVDEVFETSSFIQKNAHILLVFYEHQPEVNALDLQIKLVGDWRFPPADLEVIRQDWSSIVQKIKAGKAHELSEGDTFYLAACTKGANANSLRRQPHSAQPAMQRAFSLKQGYVNHIIANLAGDAKPNYGKLLVAAPEIQSESIEAVVLRKLRPYCGKSIAQLTAEAGVALNDKAKNFTANLTNLLLGVELDKQIEEFEKAEITVKTVRLSESNLPKESMSFPHFKYEEIAQIQWEDSEFKQRLERKFLVVFLKYIAGELYFDKAVFWNMEPQHLLEAQRVWLATQALVRAGTIVTAIKNGRRFTAFPTKQFSAVAHVRPHARNAADVFPLPVPDVLTGLQAYTKHCFWLNNHFIRDAIYLKSQRATVIDLFS